MYNLSYGRNEDTQILENIGKNKKKLWKIMKRRPENVQSLEKINYLQVTKHSNIKITNIKATQHIKDHKENTR